MPINRALYPADWEAISQAVKDEAGWRCEGSPAFPNCRAQHGQAHPVTYVGRLRPRRKNERRHNIPRYTPNKM